MDNKQLYEKQSNQYNPFFPIVRLEDIIDNITEKSIQWILNNYNHIYVEYSESREITRNKVPQILRRNGLWISYNNGKKNITEYYIGKNTDVNNYVEWTLDDNWKTINDTPDFNTFGAFLYKPELPPVGFAYFCTDRQTAEGVTNGIMIYHKGNNIWVDALGRLIE